MNDANDKQATERLIRTSLAIRPVSRLASRTAATLVDAAVEAVASDWLDPVATRRDKGKLPSDYVRRAVIDALAETRVLEHRPDAVRFAQAVLRYFGLDAEAQRLED